MLYHEACYTEAQKEKVSNNQIVRSFFGILLRHMNILYKILKWHYLIQLLQLPSPVKAMLCNPILSIS